MPPENHPRDLAVRVLTRVLSDRVPLDVALDELSAPATRGWLQEVCSGALRWKGRLDHVLDSVALKKKPSGWLRKALLIAAYQLIVQDRVPAAQVVSETVNEVKKREGNPPAAFANAILRKIADHRAEWSSIDIPPASRVQESAQQASLPDWLWKRIVSQQSEEWARAYAKASLERPSIWVRAKDPSWIPAWAERGPVPGSLRLLEGGAIQEKEGFKEGSFFVQDISSQYLIHEISQQVKGKSGEKPRALDLCAAPGGKSAGLAWNSFQVTASDENAARFRLLQETTQRLGLPVQLIPFDQVDGVEAQDLVWVDSPCSGSGILRRHPDVRWLRREQELKDLCTTQAHLLKKGWDKVRPGGFLVYSVCSILREEGPEVLKTAGLNSYSKKEWLLAPHLEPHGDGFWAALLQKPEAL